VVRGHTARRGATLLAVALLAVLLAACGAGPAPTATTARTGNISAAATVVGKKYPGPPPMTIDQDKQYFATIKTTMGNIKIELFPKDASVTVNNFVFLARDGYYDNTPFHRVIKDFMIQGGDPTGTGTGNPGYRFQDEPVKGAYDVGSVAMANSGPNTNGSQFFICEGSGCKRLDPVYNLFGKVVDGMDVVHKIADVPKTVGSDGAQSLPVQPVKITTIEITEQ